MQNNKNYHGENNMSYTRNTTVSNELITCMDVVRKRLDSSKDTFKKETIFAAP
jgi:hypothetical protein